jgi:bifunctional NMN adenylyltransferase/nudix hydrolase
MYILPSFQVILSNGRNIMSKEKSLGVVIGRFQIHELHEGHVALLDYVAELHTDMLILIGHNSIRFNTVDPFPFHIRKQMLESRYPKAVILPLLDSPISNEHWSSVVDEKVAATSYNGKATLYGSRDSFIPKYSGRFPTQEVPAFANCSATKVRAEVALEYINDPMFRLGWLAAIREQYVVTDPTVDMAIHTADWNRILMGRRGTGSQLRFFGGFVDKDDQSYEVAANREQAEEALGIEVCEPQYIGSLRINDPRYGRSEYGIMTTFFGMEYKGGDAYAGDDMGLVEWCDLEASLTPRVSPTHHGLFKLLLAHKEKQLAGKQ